MADFLRFLVVCLVWGGSFWLMKEASAVFGPLTIGGTRVALGGAALGTWAWMSSRRQSRRETRLGSRGGNPSSAAPAPRTVALRAVLGRRSAALGFAVVVVLGFIYPFWMQPRLIGLLGQSGFIGMTVSVVPLSTIAASAVLLRRCPSLREGFGVGAGLLAMPLLAGAGASVGVGPWAFALALSVPIAYAVSNTVIKATLSEVGPVRLTAAACGVAAIVLVPAAFSESIRWPEQSVGLWRAGVALLLLAIVGTGLATALFYRLIQTRGPLYAGMVTYVIPMEALLLGWLDGEAITPLQGVALAIILGSVAVVQMPLPRRKNQSPRRPAPSREAATPAARPPLEPER